MASGEEFEALTEEIFRVLTSDVAESGKVTVERNVMLDGHDGPRQIDIVLRSSVGPIDILTIIECKDYKRKTDVTKVDALHSVLQDVRASKAILVSRGGFSRTAIQKATRLGIGLYRANQLGNVREAVTEVPVYVREIRPASVKVDGRAALDAGTTLSTESLLNVNDIDVLTLLRDDLLTSLNPLDAPSGRRQWTHPRLSAPWHVRDVTGKQWELLHLEISYILIELHYFGYLSDTTAAVYLSDEVKAEVSVLVKAEEFLIDYKKRFNTFDGPDVLPAAPAIMVDVLGLPDPHADISSAEFSIEAMG